MPDATDALASDSSIIERNHDGSIRYHRVSESPFGPVEAHFGRLIAFADITDREDYRRELERQNERLDQFASMVSHDLRNPLNVAMARIEWLLTRTTIHISTRRWREPSGWNR